MGMLSSSTDVRREEDASQRVSGRIAPAEEPDHAVVELEDLERHISTSTPDDEDGDIVGTLKDVDKSGRVNRSNSSFMPKPKTPMNVMFEDVCCYVPASFETPGILSTLRSLGTLCAGKEAKHRAREKQILHHIQGQVCPGEVIAIMGPSGSGKTTFISLLAGRNSLRTTGSILYNGEHKPTDKAFKRQLGYVSQEDVLFEALYYTAVLRLPRAMTDKDKRERVNIILEVLGISHVKDSIVGGIRIGRRGISGGEKKRVAIGQELLYNPSVILLDEPTSGLDSTTALNLIHTLHTLAQAGNRTILTTIHQPSSRIYQMLDKLLLMGLGHLLYYGDASVACDYFTKIGYAMPYGMNPADYFLDIASGWSGESEDNNTIDASDPELKHLLKAIEAQPYSRESSSKFNDLVLSTRSVESERELFGMTWKSSARDLQSPSREGPTFWTQMTVIAIRSLKDRRFERFSSDSMMTVFFMAFLCGILWWQAGTGGSLSTYVGALDVTAVLF